MSKPKKSQKIPFFRKLIFSCITTILIFILVFGIGEIVCRTILNVQPTVKHKPHAPYDTAKKNDQLGWQMTPNYTFSGEMKDKSGKDYSVTLAYDEQGFKSFGAVNSSRPKVFFIGDSYIASIEVSNSKTFYNLVADSLNIEVFAYGQAGFGTLQQLMILEKYLAEIQPDLILWQTCSNDFIDNSAELEMKSGYKVGERRPYLDSKGEIIYKRPLSTLQKLAEYSGFFHFLQKRWKNIQFDYLNEGEKVAEYYIGKDKKAYPPYAASIATTRDILQKAKATIPDSISVIGFSADTFEPQASDFQELFEEQGWEYSLLPARLVQKGQQEKKVVHSADGYHWNNTGHRIMADGVIQILQGNLK